MAQRCQKSTENASTTIIRSDGDQTSGSVWSPLVSAEVHGFRSSWRMGSGKIQRLRLRNTERAADAVRINDGGHVRAKAVQGGRGQQMLQRFDLGAAHITDLRLVLHDGLGSQPGRWDGDPAGAFEVGRRQAGMFQDAVPHFSHVAFVVLGLDEQDVERTDRLQAEARPAGGESDGDLHDGR